MYIEKSSLYQDSSIIASFPSKDKICLILTAKLGNIFAYLSKIFY
ncbi:hypothetical protein CLOSTMETH_00913 [[Clostridium] methylpentosum DSM 5476]|uniref:Uncharacterized protein n=1 Tax=[Clostridium] methylpentosum DSM 5476 TaxID=537013 RepID=C0EAP9_9FIRM|nr:hypothetical protein CLOSTMETH_00913 [[Clostridium] methylpentosum DSM 5476]